MAGGLHTFARIVRVRAAINTFVLLAAFSSAAYAQTDTSAPVISRVQASSVGVSTAVVTWTTNEPSDSQVDYGVTTAYGSSSPLDSALVTTHSVALTGLTDATTYHLRVRSRDAAGNLAVAAPTLAPPFSTLWDTTAVANGTHTLTAIAFDAAGNSTSSSVSIVVNNDTQAPVISKVRASRVSFSGATISWTTNEPADTRVEYGTTTAYESGAVADSTMSTTHSVALSNLTPETVYHYRVWSRDAGGNLSGSGDLTFTTSRIVLNRKNLYFGATLTSTGTATATAALRSTSITPTQTISVDVVDGSGDWIASADQPWIRISPTSGTGSASLQVWVEAGATSSAGTITVAPAGSTRAAQRVPVIYTVFSATAPPGGQIDTPSANLSGVVGSLAVTGWVVHDIGVAKVQIWRDAVAGEPSGARIFIGDATLVDGARPDIESAFGKPFNYQAGWGFLILTNMLPNRGNGTFTLYAVAVAIDGSTAALGSRTITCDNAHANRPFGTIDTPAQGATVSGRAYVNFGWALTANPGLIPRDGSTLHVFIDGVRVGSPAYDQYRSDIAALFPDLANSAGAVGYFVIDTETLANGVHTIAWLVTDTLGRAEGIGSRFFTVLNQGATTALAAERPASELATVAASRIDRSDLGRSAEQISAAPSDVALVRHGYETVPDIVVGGDAGRLDVVTHELEPVQISVATGDDAASYAGYLVNDGRLRELPAGSTLDRSTGTFVWQPGAAFIGPYDFVFVKTDSSSRTQTRVRVTVEPSTLHGPHAHSDTAARPRDKR